MTHDIIEGLAEQRWLDSIARPLGRAVRAAFRNAGPVGYRVKDALHGVWFGHPLHPALTDVPLGAWTAAVALDGAEAATRDPAYGRGADVAFGVGLVGAVASAVTGLTDWSDTEGRARRLGLVHGLMNVAATALVATGLAMRRRHQRAAGTAYTAAGVGVSMAAAYLGGALVFHEGVGVRNAVVETSEVSATHAKQEQEEPRLATSHP